MVDRRDEEDSDMSRSPSPKRLRLDDRDIIMKAVSLDGLALGNARKGLQSDREIVLRAVSQNGLALQYADEELWGIRCQSLINNSVHTRCIGKGEAQQSPLCWCFSGGK